MKNNDPRIAMMQSLSLPFLVHGRSIGVEEDYPYLDVDNEGAFRDATQLLLQLGHTRIGLLNGPAGYDFTFRRCLGVEKAMAANGLALHAENVRHGSMTDEEGYLGMEALLSRPEKPTAILCASTALALGAIRSLNQRGLKPGKDISLIAHDDVLPLLKPDNFSVPLTTTRSSLRAAGCVWPAPDQPDQAQPDGTSSGTLEGGTGGPRVDGAGSESVAGHFKPLRTSARSNPLRDGRR